MKIKILFICLGNICRSPAAEGVMKALVHDAERDEEFYIDSAGIGGWHVGQHPDPRMVQAGKRRGYVFNSRARQITKTDFEDFDYILAMDEDNIQELRHKAPEYTDKIKLLADYITVHKDAKVVPDPYYGDDYDFDYALDLIEDACQGLLGTL